MNQGSAPIFGERTPSGQMYRHYREPSRSEVSASTNSRYRFDSGYGVSRDMNSDLSADHPDQSQGGGRQSIAGNLDDFHVGGDTNSYPRRSNHNKIANPTIADTLPSISEALRTESKPLERPVSTDTTQKTLKELMTLWRPIATAYSGRFHVRAQTSLHFD